jgi:hypothetical protein
VYTIKSEYSAIRIWPTFDFSSVNMNLSSRIANNSVYQDDRDKSRPMKIPGLGVYKLHNLRISKRACFGEYSTDLCGWPSRGGLIVLTDATPPDFDYLQLDALDPPLRRDPNQDAEDEFCQKLLRLGAIWWDSEKRRRFVSSLENDHEEALDALEADEALNATRREAGWVRVAWPSYPPGALCVLDYERRITGRMSRSKMRPRGYQVIAMARTMDERCTVLQRLGGTMYASIEDYSGPTFLKAWEENHTGEKGPLVQEEFVDPQTYGGRPDDALNRFVSS